MGVGDVRLPLICDMRGVNGGQLRRTTKRHSSDCSCSADDAAAQERGEGSVRGSWEGQEPSTALDVDRFVSPLER